MSRATRRNHLQFLGSYKLTEFTLSQAALNGGTYWHHYHTRHDNHWQS